jgi:hypothetical protein
MQVFLSFTCVLESDKHQLVELQGPPLNASHCNVKATLPCINSPCILHAQTTPRSTSSFCDTSLASDCLRHFHLGAPFLAASTPHTLSLPGAGTMY